MNAIKVIFKNPIYNYVTSVNPKVSEEDIKKYFVNTVFDVGSFPTENHQQCISIEILKSSECSEVLQLMDQDFSYSEALQTVLKNNPTTDKVQLENELNNYI